MSEQQTCWKVGYAKRAQAERARKAIRKPKAAVRSYRCSYCGLWHLTSQGRA